MSSHVGYNLTHHCEAIASAVVAVWYKLLLTHHHYSHHPRAESLAASLTSGMMVLSDDFLLAVAYQLQDYMLFKTLVVNSRCHASIKVIIITFHKTTLVETIQTCMYKVYVQQSCYHSFYQYTLSDTKCIIKSNN